MIRALLCAALCLGASTSAFAEPGPAPVFDPTAAQIAALGDIVPSGGFAYFSGYGTKTCGMPVLYASGASPWKLTLVTTRSLEFGALKDSGKAGPPVERVQEAFRRAVADCGFPVPEAAAGSKSIKGSIKLPRKMDPAVMKPLTGPATMAYLAGVGKNFHNLPAVFAMRHGDAPMLVVAGKDSPPKTFALPGGWSDAMKAYATLLQARGYR